MRRQRGFTILEVLIVVAIIGIIAAIAMANYLNALQRTKQRNIPRTDGQLIGNAYTTGPTTEFDCDIVFSGGSFVAWPEGTQSH